MGGQKTMIKLKGGKSFFYITIITHWNSLPRECLLTLFLEVFKTGQSHEKAVLNCADLDLSKRLN